MNYIMYALLGVISVCLIFIIVLLYKNYKKLSSGTRSPLGTDEPEGGTETTSSDPQITIIHHNPKSIIIPDDVAFDANCLPYRMDRAEKKSPNYGRGFNAYITKGGKCYHKRKTCSSLKHNKNIIVKHIYECIVDDRFTPCSYCNPKTKVDAWYIAKFPESKYSQTDTDKNDVKPEQLSLIDD